MLRNSFRGRLAGSAQNQLYEKLNVKKQVCGVNTRGGASTQDPDYPEGHPKGKEQKARKKKLSASKYPNENQDKYDSEKQDNDISISDAETEDNNNEEEESSSPKEEPQEVENIKESEAAEKEDRQPSTEKNKKKTIQVHKKVKKGIHGYKDPYHVLKR